MSVTTGGDGVMATQMTFQFSNGGSIPTSSLHTFNYTVIKVDWLIGRTFIKKHHYSQGAGNGSMCYGLFDGDHLIGVCAFATPCSEAVCASVFGVEHKRSVTELHRLVLLDQVPKNSESWFISRALKALKKDRPNYCAVLSFADATENHIGTIYQATNAIYCGTSPSKTFYLDGAGKLWHPRQNGVNISKSEATARGWKLVKRDGKHRYLYILSDNKKHKKELISKIQLVVQPYPKAVE